MSKETLLMDFNFWRNLVNAWSVVFFGVIIYDAQTGNGAETALQIVSIVYIGVLAIYISNKEFERWYHHHKRQHPGEIFVIAWSVLIAILLVVSIVTRGAYHLPETVVSSYIAVLSILAITRKSREVYRSRYSKD